jgi:hypothetical protein
MSRREPARTCLPELPALSRRSVAGLEEILEWPQGELLLVEELLRAVRGGSALLEAAAHT